MDVETMALVIAIGFPLWIVFMRNVFDYLTTGEIFHGPRNQ